MESRSLQLAILAPLFLTLAVVFVSLRCFVRIFLKHCFWADDALTIISLMLYIVASVVLMIGVWGGIYGHHWQTLSPAALEMGLKIAWIFELAYIASTMFIKLAICLFLRRFTIDWIHKWIIYVVFAIQCIFGVFLFCFALAQCRPVSAFWTNPFNEGGACNRVGTLRVTYAHGVINSVSDWTLALLPILMVRKMNLNLRTKIYISIVLAIGSCASIATIARFPYVHLILDPKSFFNDTHLILWSYLEVGIAIIASSAATLRPLMVLILSLSGRHRRGSADSQQNLYQQSEYTVRRPSTPYPEIDVETESTTEV